MSGAPGPLPSTMPSRTLFFHLPAGPLHSYWLALASRYRQCAVARVPLRARSPGHAAHWQARTITTLRPGLDLLIGLENPIAPYCAALTEFSINRSLSISSSFSESTLHLSASIIALTT